MASSRGLIWKTALGVAIGTGAAVLVLLHDPGRTAGPGSQAERDSAGSAHRQDRPGGGETRSFAERVANIRESGVEVAGLRRARVSLDVSAAEGSSAPASLSSSIVGHYVDPLDSGVANAPERNVTTQSALVGDFVDPMSSGVAPSEGGGTSHVGEFTDPLSEPTATPAIPSGRTYVGSYNDPSAEPTVNSPPAGMDRNGRSAHVGRFTDPMPAE